MAKEKGHSVLDRIAEEFDDVTVGKAEDIRTWVDTGNYALNKIVSGDYFKGYPCGKIIELFGDPSTGKSFFIYAAIASFQKKFGARGYTLLDDVEDSYMSDVAEMLGVDSKRMIIKSSETVEDHFRKFFSGVRGKKSCDDEDDKKKQPGLVPFILEEDPEARILVALDSVAMLSTEHEQEVMFDRDDMTKAKKLRAGIRMNWGLISSREVLYIIANHVIADIGVQYGNPKTTPGGKAIPFMSSVRVELSIKQKLKQGEKIIGVETEAFTRKNKIAPPFRRARIKIYFEKGIDRMSGVADMLLEDGILRRSGGYLVTAAGEKFYEKDFTEETFLKLMDNPEKK